MRRMQFATSSCGALTGQCLLWLLSAVILISAAGTARAQLPHTRLYAVSPPGAQVGTSVDVTLSGGADLDEVDRVHFSHPGITGTQKKNDAGAPVTNVFVVAVAADVPPGLYEVRASGLFGMSNPRTFVVGTRAEGVEKEGNNTPEQSTPLEFSHVYNGVIGSATDIDYFKFTGKQGQRVVVTCQSAEIDSRLSAILELYDANGRRLAAGRGGLRNDPLVDASLPADGEYFIKLHDYVYRGGGEYFYRLAAGTGPHIDFILPPAGVPNTTGKYTLYGSNLPGSTPAEMIVQGRPLEKLEVEIALPAAGASLPVGQHLSSIQADVEGSPYTLDTPAGRSNALLMHFASAPVSLEVEPNNDASAPQKISVPGEIAGQFQATGDVDVFQFDAKAKEVYYIEVIGQRHGSTIDPYLTLDQVNRDKDGKESLKNIATVDDNGANPAANLFDTLTDDPVYRFQVPADGTFRVTLRDRYFEARGDPRLIYRLVIRKPEPDYRLIAMPYMPGDGKAKKGTATWTLGIRKGGNIAVEVIAVRLDGFGGPIEILAEGLPAGVTTRGASIPAGQNRTSLIFTAAEDAAEWVGTVSIIGTAKNGENELLREARSGTVVWDMGDGVTPIARVSQGLALSVLKEQAPFQLATDVNRVELNQSRQLLIPLKLIKRTGFDADVTLTFLGAPKNTDVENKPVKKGAAEGLFRVFVKNNAPPGVYTLFLNSQGQVSYRRNIFLLERAKTVQAGATKKAAEQAAAAKKASEMLAAATKTATESVAAQKAATDAQKAATDKAAAAEAARQAAVAEKPKAEKAAQEAAQAVVKSASEALTGAGQRLAKSGQGVEKELEDAVALSTQIAAQLAAARKSLTDTRAAADKKIADTTAARKQAAVEMAAAQMALNKAQTAATVAETVRKESEAAKTAADAAAKQTADAKAAADKQVAEADKKTKAANVNVFFPSTPIVITVKPGPATLVAAVPEKGNLKIGGKLDVKVTVNRINDFKGPVTLELPLPPGIKGISAAPVTVPADKNEAQFTIQAAADAPEAQLANMVVRGKMEFNGQAAVDVPIGLKVIK